MTNLHDIAPRLARARDEEIVYQTRLRLARRKGEIPADFVLEEMARSCQSATRIMTRYAQDMRAVSDMMNKAVERARQRQLQEMGRLNRAYAFYDPRRSD